MHHVGELLDFITCSLDQNGIGYAYETITLQTIVSCYLLILSIWILILFQFMLYPGASFNCNIYLAWVTL